MMMQTMMSLHLAANERLRTLVQTMMQTMISLHLAAIERLQTMMQQGRTMVLAAKEQRISTHFVSRLLVHVMICSIDLRIVYIIYLDVYIIRE